MVVGTPGRQVKPVMTILALLAYLSMMMALSIVVLMFGWGLTPQNWWVIFGIGVVGHSLGMSLGNRLLKELKDE